MRGSACNFDSAPQGNLSCTFLLQPRAVRAVKRQTLTSTVAPPRLLYMVTGLGGIQGFHFSSSVFCLISHPTCQGKKMKYSCRTPTHVACLTPRAQPTKGPLPCGTSGIPHDVPRQAPNTTCLPTSPTFVHTSPL